MTISTGSFDSFGIPQGSPNRLDDLADVDTTEAKEGNTIQNRGGRWVPVDGNEVAVQGVQPTDLGVELWVNPDEADPPPALDVVTADARYVNVEGDLLKGPLPALHDSLGTNTRIGSWNYTDGQVTGYLVITLPKTGGLSPMAVWKIHGYDLYGGGFWEVVAAGYHYTTANPPQWYSPNAEFRGTAPNKETVLMVRLLTKGATNDPTYAICLGNPDTTWSYPVVTVEAMLGYNGSSLADKPVTFTVTADISSWRMDAEFTGGAIKTVKNTYPEVKLHKALGGANYKTWNMYVSGLAGETGNDAAALSFASVDDADSQIKVIRMFRDGRLRSIRPYTGVTRGTDTALTADVESRVLWETVYGQPGNTQAAVTMASVSGGTQFTVIHEGTYIMELGFSMVNSAVKSAPIDFGIRETGGGSSTVTMTAVNTIANSWSDRLSWTSINAWPAGYSFYVYIRPVGASGGTGWKYTYARCVIHQFT